MMPTEETSRLYADALRMVATGRELDNSMVIAIARACRTEGLAPAAVVRMHAALSASSLDGEGASSVEVGQTLGLLERVLGRYHDDVLTVAHDLCNSVQLVTGSLSLLQRDLEHRGGTRTRELTTRARKHASDLQRCIEELPLGRSDRTKS